MGTLRSYQVLLITQSQCFSSRTRSAESRASTKTAVARSSRCEAAKAFAFEAFRPAMPTRSTAGLERRSGTVAWAIAPYPPRMRTFTVRPGSPEVGSSFTVFAGRSDLRHARGRENRAAGEDEGHARAERHRVSEVLRGESPEEGAEDRAETLDRVVGPERLRSAILGSEPRHEGRARDIDQGPAESDAGVQRDGGAETYTVRQRRDPDEQERREQHRSAHGRIQLRRSIPAGRDPTADARIHGDRGRLARDVDREDLGTSESVRLLQENREEPIERGESAEQEEDADEIHAERVRKSHLPSPVERVDVVKDPDRQISTALDAGIDVGEVNVPAIHADRRFPSPDLNEETGQQPERGADHEEREHRRQLRAEQSRSDGEPCDPHAQSRDPPDRADPTHQGEPRRPFRSLRGLHEEDRPGGAARGAQETREEIRKVELGHGPAQSHRKEGEPAPEETNQEEDLAARGAIGERSPEDEGRDRREARGGRDDAHREEGPSQRVREQRNQGRRRAAGDALREVRVEPMRPVRPVHPIPSAQARRRTRGDV